MAFQTFRFTIYISMFFSKQTLKPKSIEWLLFRLVCCEHRNPPTLWLTLWFQSVYSLDSLFI